MLALIAVVVIFVFGVMIYNSLVKLREQADGAWADIDVQLKRRYDLVPNLVETVKGYAGHEKETLEAVIQARNMAMSAQGPAEQGRAEGMLTNALKSIFALSEAYPDLKAQSSFHQLQGTLTDLEDHVQKARRYYNAVIRDYNTKIATIPQALIARSFGFREKEFFEIPDGQSEAPTVNFD